MPRACNIPYCREQFVFAITAKDPSSICLSPPDKIKPSNQITSAEGYLGQSDEPRTTLSFLTVSQATSLFSSKCLHLLRDSPR